MITRPLAALVALALCTVPTGAQVQETLFESGGVELKAYLHKHTGSGPRALAIYLHGNPGSRLDESSKIADALTAVGVDVLRFNYRGLWGNGGEFNLSNAIADLDAALDFLTAPETAERFELEPSRVILIGYSFGTATALVGARDDERVAGIVSLAPCDHGYFGREWMNPDSEIRDFLVGAVDSLFGEGGPIEQDASIFLDDLTKKSQAHGFPQNAESLLDKKLLFLVGSDDEVCYAEDHFFPLYRRLRALGHPALEGRVLAMDHGFEGVGLEALMQIAAEWVVRSFPLPPSEAPRSN